MESEYLSDAFGSRISVKDGAHKHSPSPLGHTEMLRVKSAPADQIPALGQRVENDSEIPAAVAGVEPLDVLHKDGAGSKSVSDSHELVEEAAALSCESGPLPCDGEVLAGEAPAEEVKTMFGLGTPPAPLLLSVGLTCPSVRCLESTSDVSHVVIDVDAGEPGGENCAAVGVNLGEEEVSEPGPCKANVHSSDA